MTDDPAVAAVCVDKAIAGCAEDDVEEINSLGRTLASWRTEILEHHTTGASNGPTEGLNLCVKRVSAAAMAFGPSTTTGSECCSMPAASPGRRAHHHPRIRARAPQFIA